MPEQAPLGAKCLDKPHMSSEAKAKRDKDEPGSRLHHEIAPGAHAQVVEQARTLRVGNVRTAPSVVRHSNRPSTVRDSGTDEPCRGLRRRRATGGGAFAV